MSSFHGYDDPGHDSRAASVSGRVGSRTDFGSLADARGSERMEFRSLRLTML